MIQETGISHFAVHFRLKDQTAKFKADWKKIKDIVYYNFIKKIKKGKISKNSICDKWGCLLSRRYSQIKKFWVNSWFYGRKRCNSQSENIF